MQKSILILARKVSLDPNLTNWDNKDLKHDYPNLLIKMYLSLGKDRHISNSKIRAVSLDTVGSL